MSDATLWSTITHFNGMYLIVYVTGEVQLFNGKRFWIVVGGN